ncbi:MAG: methylenetetrahydrofolate--tRNA-(uracil(54)-C(5))-methyltransferase (FADH(2)-oxidizing) TrmFO, partial [Acutalibacteraceae bacterium]|nr:methylenetetrahydrofolate--tRNA-(uracil(54)-C(5))-methyltransferase (FADH(2)-oxidizing) TrmFO [Acutalibacteraceae bacterium]
PLASDALADDIHRLCEETLAAKAAAHPEDPDAPKKMKSKKNTEGKTALHFYDAVAPIVSGDSIDMTKAFAQSRYDRGGEDDYINCPMNKEEYERFYEALVSAESAELHDFDKGGVYEGCMPIEVMAKRGHDTIRFGPMKPVGLTDPRTGHRPWAALQLRKETAEGTMYNLVGFQTNLKFGEQKRVFSMIPGLEHAEFLRYGVMHRNTFLNSPELLNADFQFRTVPGLYFAGQITGVEGYMESAMSGILAGVNAARALNGEAPLVLPPETMMGALSRYIADPAIKEFQPMGANFGVLPPLEEKIRDKKLRYEKLAERSLDYFDQE